MKRFKTSPKNVLTVILVIFWVFMEQRLETAELAAGVIVTVATMLVIQKICPVSSERLKLTFSAANTFVAYLLMLIKDIIVANIQVAVIILSPRLSIRPGIQKYNLQLKSQMIRFLYANSITLTPGTLTVEMNDSSAVVHVLDKKKFSDLENWNTGRQLIKLDGDVT